MYIKQIISVHPRSSCTIFCAKCGTALLKIRPFEGFAPQLYPENPKMRYSSTQAPASPSALASRISLLSGLPHLPPPHLPHLSPPRLPRFLPPSHHLRLPPAVHRACDSAEREGKRRNRRRTEKRRGTGRKTEEPAEKRRNRRRTGKRRNRRRTEKRRGREEREEREEKRRNRRGREEKREEKRRGREEVINRRGCANCIEFQRFLRKLLINKK